MIIERRREDFIKYEQIHSRFHREDAKRYQDILHRFSQSICAAGQSVEVGFGYGHELIQFLKKGANIFGVDLSVEAVSQFRSLHPEYAKRVSGVSDWNSEADVLYSNAVFEHLDEPGEFLRKAFITLKPDGKLLMRLPLIACENYATSQIRFDINFWKPCHRVLYTLKGLKTLFESHGFRIVDSAGYAYYGYKVMSAMLRHGYRDIEIVRDPWKPIKHLESEWMYTMILLHGLVKRTICAEFALIATKADYAPS
ncbi:MAG TPA: class I SAM-dependent methyltransferase [Nitrospira sp.]|nr:class I SAM-dependent methyltransferase [Nitrospira sp.]